MVLKSREWEERCTHCGACCGALEDPCEHLQKDLDGKCCCTVYERRFGKWHTVSGKELTCVPIRDKIAQGHSWPGDEHCDYRSNSKQWLSKIIHDGKKTFPGCSGKGSGLTRINLKASRASG